jgi:hypothetical protein
LAEALAAGGLIEALAEAAGGLALAEAEAEAAGGLVDGPPRPVVVGAARSVDVS